MFKIKNIIIIIVFIYSSYSWAVNNNELNNAIKKYFIDNNVNKEFSINSKLNLPSCGENIEIRKKYNSYKTLEVTCPQEDSWNYILRVSTKNTSKAKKNKKKNKFKRVNLVKIKNNIIKGQIITESDIVYAYVRTPGSSNYFTKKDEIIGKKAKRSIRKGQIIRVRHIEKDWTVMEGQKVIIENNISNIKILVDGIALNSAMKGEYLDVLNKSSGKTLKAWVKNNKNVSIFR